MTKDVIITVIGTQKDEAGEETRIVQKLPGEYYEKNDSVYIFYTEKDPDGGALTKNTVKLTGDTLTHTRKGNINSMMYFVQGETHATSYQSPFGILHLEFLTKELTVFRSDKSMTIKLSYDLSGDEAFISSNTLTLMIKSKEK